MPRRMLRCLAVLLTLMPLGCATALNLQEKATPGVGGGEKRPFGGVRTDLEVCAASLFNPPLLPLGGLCLVDLPLSAVADTVTLPYTVSVTAKRILTTSAPEAGMKEEGQK